MWETEDPDGRRVVLTQRQWQHILDEHPEFSVELDTILLAVKAPDRRSPGHASGEEWFYGSGAGPARWFRVVVHYEGFVGYIVTAFPRRSFP